MASEIIEEEEENRNQTEFTEGAAAEENDRKESDDADPLTLYLDSISRHSLLNPKEEKKLNKEIHDLKWEAEQLKRRFDKGKLTGEEYERRRGGLGSLLKKKRDLMVVSNLRLVVSIAKRFRNRGLPLTDLINEGNLGLIDAVERFDHRKGYRFSTYGTWWIRQALNKAVIDKVRTVRVPTHVNNSIKRHEHAVLTLTQKLGREPVQRDVAAYLGVPEEKVEQCRRYAQETSSLDSVIDSSEQTRLGDMVSATDDRRNEQGLYAESLRECIRRGVSLLNERERKIIECRYGLSRPRPLTLEETGAEVGITRERVRQLQELSVKKLRKFGVIKELEIYM